MLPQSLRGSIALDISNVSLLGFHHYLDDEGLIADAKLCTSNALILYLPYYW